MVNIQLPSSNYAALKSMQNILDREHNVYLVFDCVVDESEEDRKKIYFTRLSAQVYIEMLDFEMVGRLVSEVLNKFEGS